MMSRRTLAALAGLVLVVWLAACDSTTEPEFEWAGVYNTALGAGGHWRGSGTLEVMTDGRILFGSTMIQNHVWDGDEVSWSVADGNSSNVTIAFMESSTSEYFWGTAAPVSGRLFQGELQSPGEGPQAFRGRVE